MTVTVQDSGRTDREPRWAYVIHVPVPSTSAVTTPAPSPSTSASTEPVVTPTP